MVEVKRKERENVGSLLRRFSKKVQQSKLLIHAREIRFRQPKKSRPERRKNALKRNEIREEKEMLRKLGKLE